MGPLGVFECLLKRGNLRDGMTQRLTDETANHASKQITIQLVESW